MDVNRVSCCSIAMHGRAPEDVFRVLSEAGYRKVDLLGRMPHFDLTNPDYDFTKVMKLADRYGLRIANIGSYCGAGFASDDEDERERAIADTMAVIDAAAACGARSIRTVAGRPEDPALLDRLVACYQRVAEYAESKQVYMGIENHGGPINGNPEIAAELFRRVGSKYAGILYEPCNLQVQGVDYKQAFEIQKEFITHVHIKDAYPIEGKMQRVWLGTGVIDCRWVVGAMESIGYQGDYALEYEIDIEPAETGVGKWLDWFLHI